MKKIKNLFVSGIHQNAGKTTVSLGLYQNFKDRKYRTAFMKPVGQETFTVDKLNIDKDSYLFGAVGRFKKRLQYMSPITVGRGYTEEYIKNPQKEKLHNKILKSFNYLIKRQSAIIVEGTGHSGVGSVIDCSNADVASLLNSKVIIVSEGGIGRSIDEIMLNKALYDKLNVDVIGVIVNKVFPDKLDRIKKSLKIGLKNQGIELLGVIPIIPMLSAPTVEQIANRLKLKIFSGKKNIFRRVENTIVAAMEPHNMIEHLERGTLVITSGDRVDNILVSISSQLVHDGRKTHISGVILTGGLMPDQKIIELLEESQIPVMMSEEDTYTIAARLEGLTIKIQNKDKDKIKEAKSMVKKYVDIDTILDSL